ncbi:MAG: LysM peptidoglycan-binding domain-containing M23 family metallopeptidase [Candidatus Omnitrophica bacterium]|nr:LysM peptidoglycan-binding domain-containing M23 family metallopeptidase [Candidatus Omnitrophota bacterium]
MTRRDKSALIIVAGWLMVAVCSGCASAPIAPVASATQPLPSFKGSYHKVRPGDTLWRIARSYGLDVKTLTAANQLHGSTYLKEGQQLFVPLPVESQRFLWPLLGSLRASSASWVEIAAPAGSSVRATRGGRVAVASRQLSGLGKTVVLDHLEGHLSVYAGLDQILVSPGATLRQGMPIGILGSRVLHFEIRQGVTPKNVLALLPAE